MCVVSLPGGFISPDQLLLPLGGSFTTTPLSGHATTNIDVIRRFVDRKIVVEDVRNGLVRVVVGGG